MKCKHGLKIDWCASCSPRETRHSSFNYEIVESIYKDSPVIEILENSEPFPFDSHFRFGCKKARLILACMDTIVEFSEHTDDNGRSTVKPHTIDSIKFGGEISVSIEPHPEFVHSSGRTINKPWLSLRVMPYESPHISFGLRKAHALVSLKDQIIKWLNKQC